ncbi:unnamed protein product [Ambrosiozyma monospora]|uniref:Unnamed protein product n=1 Tax=Ambrosiozyma monospora TaxID=43982 RepID=A0ACB5SVY0_AMBMO|nr:unnamed protein product [Ambrosiozyma monospora]
MGAYEDRDRALRIQRHKERLAGQPSWNIRPITSSKDRMWPLRDVAIPVSFPDHPSFTLPPSPDDRRTAKHLSDQIRGTIENSQPNMLDDATVKLITTYYEKVFFSDITHIYKFTSSQLLQMFYLFMKNFCWGRQNGKTARFQCACRVVANEPCPLCLAIHYDIFNDVFYIRPTREAQHTHDYDMALQRIELLRDDKCKRAQLCGQTRRANDLAKYSREAIPVDIPEDSRYKLDLSDKPTSRVLVSRLNQMIKDAPMPTQIDSTIHRTYEKLFNMTNEVYVLSVSQICQLFQIYHRCFSFGCTKIGFSPICNCSPKIRGSSFGLQDCRFRWSWVPDHVEFKFYIILLRGSHNHGIEYCALKSKIEPSVFGITEIRPPVKENNDTDKPPKWSRKSYTKPFHKKSVTFVLPLSILEMANCSEPVAIPDDPSFRLPLDPSLSARDMVSALKQMYFMRVKPSVADPSIHQTFARIFHIKHQIYRFTVSQLCQLLLAYKGCFRLYARRQKPGEKCCLQVICTARPKICLAYYSLWTDFEKQVFYWRKIGDPLVVQEHKHSLEMVIAKAGYKLADLNINLNDD